MLVPKKNIPAQNNIAADSNKQESSAIDIVKTDNRPEAKAIQKFKQLQSQKQTVQRLLVPFKTPAAPDANEVSIATDAAAIEALTNAAYLNTWQRLNDSTRAANPVALDIAQFPGVTQGHFATLLNRLAGNDDTLKATAVGYVIEDQVSFSANKPAAAATQVVVQNARPDFVITHGNKRGILDITSSRQQGHVMNKDFTKANFPYIAESTYASINFAALNGGAAPLLGGGAAALADQAKRRNANSFIGSQLNRLKNLIRLNVEGNMQNNLAFGQAAMVAINTINAMPVGAWTAPQIGALDASIQKVNALLPVAAAQLETGSQIITIAQNNYLLAGNPYW